MTLRPQRTIIFYTPLFLYFVTFYSGTMEFKQRSEVEIKKK